MLPGLGGMNPAQMKAMMKQFGIKSEDLDVSKVTIELTNGSKLIFDSPTVNAVDMKGQKTYTITGESVEEKGEEVLSEDDIDMVAEQAQVSKEDARTALEDNDGDIAEAIASLKKEE
ncbi:MAG: nascent polypeptide-associated complex protein [archaeon]